MWTRRGQERIAALLRRRAGAHELTTDGLGERRLYRSHLTLHARRGRRDAPEQSRGDHARFLCAELIDLGPTMPTRAGAEAGEFGLPRGGVQFVHRHAMRIRDCRYY